MKSYIGLYLFYSLFCRSKPQVSITAPYLHFQSHVVVIQDKRQSLRMQAKTFSEMFCVSERRVETRSDPWPGAAIVGFVAVIRRRRCRRHCGRCYCRPSTYSLCSSRGVTWLWRHRDVTRRLGACRTTNGRCKLAAAVLLTQTRRSATEDFLTGLACFSDCCYSGSSRLKSQKILHCFCLI